MFACWWCNLTPIMLVTVSLSSGYIVKRNWQKAKVMADMSVVYAAIHNSVRIHSTEVQKWRKTISKTCDTANLLCCSFSNEANSHTTSWYIYFNFSTCFGQLCAHHQENLLYLCDTGIFHSVWVVVWSAAADQTATHTEWKIPVSHRYSKFFWWWAHSCPKHVEKLK